MTNNEDATFAIWSWKQVTGLLALISIIPIWYAVNDRHMDHLDATYAKKSEVLFLAQAQQLEKKVVELNEAQKNNSNKLDFLVKAEAAKTVIAIRQEIAFHKTHEDTSTLWKRELNDMENRLRRAENYRTCIVSNQENCDAERIW